MLREKLFATVCLLAQRIALVGFLVEQFEQDQACEALHKLALVDKALNLLRALIVVGCHEFVLE